MATTTTTTTSTTADVDSTTPDPTDVPTVQTEDEFYRELRRKEEHRDTWINTAVNAHLTRLGHATMSSVDRLPLALIAASYDVNHRQAIGNNVGNNLNIQGDNRVYCLEPKTLNSKHDPYPPSTRMCGLCNKDCNPKGYLDWATIVCRGRRAISVGDTEDTIYVSAGYGSGFDSCSFYVSPTADVTTTTYTQLVQLSHTPAQDAVVCDGCIRQLLDNNILRLLHGYYLNPSHTMWCDWCRHVVPATDTSTPRGYVYARGHRHASVCSQSLLSWRRVELELAWDDEGSCCDSQVYWWQPGRAEPKSLSSRTDQLCAACVHKLVDMGVLTLQPPPLHVPVRTSAELLQHLRSLDRRVNILSNTVTRDMYSQLYDTRGHADATTVMLDTHEYTQKYQQQRNELLADMRDVITNIRQLYRRHFLLSVLTGTMTDTAGHAAEEALSELERT